MKDLAIGPDFNVIVPDDRNDLALVDGQEEFEQNLAVWVTDYFYREIGSVDEPNVESRLELQASRVARLNDRIDSLASISVSRSETEPNTLEVRLFYRSGEEFDFTIS
ncbi:hypothetical protein [Halapricum desulfuricans]|uniref:Uncharacterized protein n=1 Tax=Halapricum desulfuricans TaxID=2841257 RepID=A0A897N1M2_9EURY|nr:hypothetical protein [Halapricum desulfuricans]QSG06411.1 hypothetical protein HSR121_2079 [Halapricum desulfuricans]